MKMKKLTALALAGVLCLGMSTTAFAAASPLPETAMEATDSYGDSYNVWMDEPDSAFDGWRVENKEKASDNVKKDLKEILKGINEALDEENEKDTPDLNKIRALEAEKKALGVLPLDKENVKFEVATIGDLQSNFVFEEGSKGLDVKFYLNDCLEKISQEDEIYVMHEGTNGWAVTRFTGEQIVWDNVKNQYYVKCNFKDFSPVAIIRANSAEGIEVLPPEENPKDDPKDDPTVTPGTNGSISADQLVDMIVNRLEKSINATKVVRTAASGKASPKTGE